VKKILLVADQPGWIFERHCIELKTRLTEFHIDIVFRKHNVPELSKNYDLVYVLDPIPLSYGYPPQSKTIIGLRNEFLYREHPNGAKGLYEYGFPGRCVSIKDKCFIFHVVNNRLMNVFKGVVDDKPLLLAQHGVSMSVFNRDQHKRIDGDILRVSTSGRGSANKGFSIVEEACKELGLISLTTQYGDKKLPKEKMPEFYSNADVHVCMSKTEGLNNPILEAGAMGVPVISTDSGAATEMIKDKESGFIIGRNKQALKEALMLMQDKSLREKLGNNLYLEIKNNWSWDVKINDFRSMFEVALNAKF